MNLNFAWISEGSRKKAERALNELRKRNDALRAQKQPEVEITESAIKELYVKWGGLVLEESAEPIVAPVEAPTPRSRRSR